MAEGFLFDVAEGILGKLGNLAGQEIALLWGVKDELLKLNDTVSTIKDVLLDAEEQQAQNRTVKNWLGKLKDVVHEADDLVDDVSTEALRCEVMTRNKKAKKVRIFFSKSNQLAYGLKLAHKIKAIRERLDAIAANMAQFNFVVRPIDTQVCYRVREQTHSFVVEEEVIGREGDKKAITERLLCANVEESVSILPIVGIGGLGKTTLVQLVFNDDNIGNHFEKKMWVCVSDNFDVKEIVEKILESVTKKKPEKDLQMDTLVENLKEEIDGKRYLLVLDDVWSEDRAKWDKLRAVLKGGARGSRVLLTTRLAKVAKITKTIEPFFLNGLDDDKSWALFKQKAFENGQEPKNSKILEIGMEIVKKCVGVPLAIRSIGSMLYFKEEAQWLAFTKYGISKMPQYENDILPTLKLSYDHLPSHLKHCFAFCRLFPKDYKIRIPTLINLWLAEGFIKSEPNQCVEDVGHDYFMDLLWRSFFQEVEKDEWGNLNTCKMHDLMHDLAIEVAGNESTTLDSNVENIDEKTHHVSFGFDLNSSSQIPSTLFKASRMRTFLLPNQSYYSSLNVMNSYFESIISSFKFLRVLDMNQTRVDIVPNRISKLKHLRYLDLSGNNNIKMLPNSITKLQNLRTLSLSRCSELQELPRDIHKLVSLRCLEIDGCDNLTYMPPGLGQLTNLQTLSEFVLGDKDLVSACGGLKELHGLNNLRGKLTIQILRPGKNAAESKDANLKGKEHLQVLYFSWEDKDVSDADARYYEMSLEYLEPHPNIRKLRLGNYGGVRSPSWLPSLSKLVEFSLCICKKWQHLPPLDQLPHLKVLKLIGLDAMEYILLSEESGSSEELSVSSFFPSLEQLYLRYCPNLKGWWRKMDSVEEHHLLLPSFPRLSYLNVEACPKLTSMPLFPYLESKLFWNNAGIKPLQQTMMMKMKNMESPKSPTPSTSSSTVVTSSFAPLSNLKSLLLWNINDLESLLEDWLRNLTSLEELDIQHCPKLRCLSQGIQHLTALEKLEISLCEHFDISNDGDGMQWQGLRSLRQLKFNKLPKLLSLPVGLQHVTTLQDLKIFDCDSLMARPEWISGLTFLQSFRILGCPNLKSLPEGMRALTSMQTLEIYCCPNLTSLPEGMRALTSLQTLGISKCPNLTSLPEGMRALTSLQTLEINRCLTLSQRCKRDTGEDWPNISHIPNLRGDAFFHSEPDEDKDEDEGEDEGEDEAYRRNKGLRLKSLIKDLKNLGCYNCSTTQ